MGGQGFGIELKSVTSLQPWSHTTATEVEVLWCGRDYHDWEEITQHLPGEWHWALQRRQGHWAYCYALRPWVYDNARAHRALVVPDHLQFRRITTLPRPQIYLQLNICGTSSGDVSGDGLTSHRTSTRSLMHSRRNGAGSPRQPLGGS